MERYTIEQRVFIVKSYYKFGERFAEAGRKYRTKYGTRKAPPDIAIRKIVTKFEETGNLEDARSKTYSRRGRSQENIASVSDSVAENRKTSIRRRAQQLGLNRQTLHNILRKDLHLKA